MKVTYKLTLKSMFLIAGIAMSPIAFAEDETQIWGCNTGIFYFDDDDEHILWLVKGTQDSYVKFYDERIPATYYLYGLERRWDWEDGNFSIRLKPNNTALYFDFNSVGPGETTTALSQFSCGKK